MNLDNAVRVKILNGESCVYEQHGLPSVENDLRTLVRDLRATQSRINEVLTSLIQQRNTADADTTNRPVSSDVESDSSETDDERRVQEIKEQEVQVKSKKCKLSM